MSDTSKRFNKNAVAGPVLAALLSGCAAMSNKSFEDYNMCMDVTEYHQKFDPNPDDPGYKDPGFFKNLYNMAGLTTVGACYFGQEILRIPIHLGAMTELILKDAYCGLTTGESYHDPYTKNPQTPQNPPTDSPTGNVVLPKNEHSTFCNPDP